MLLTDTQDRSKTRARLTALVFALFASLASAPSNAQDSCTRPLCQSGERFQPDSSPTASFGWCYTERLTFVAHQRRECPAGWTLQRTNGTCVQQNCCPEKPLCYSNETYGESRTSGGRTYGICNSSGAGGSMAHRLAYCPEGWRLDTARGVCRKDCPKVTGTIKGPAPPVVSEPKVTGTVKGPAAPVAAGSASKAAKPDLVLRSMGLLRVGRCEPGAVVLTFRVKVANIGSAASPAVAGRVQVQVKEPRRGWGQAVDLPALAPGATVELDVPVSYFRTDPGFMVSGAPHAFRAAVDPLGAVDEADEGNNKSNTINVAAPTGCK